MHAEARTRLCQLVLDPIGIAGVIIHAGLCLMTRASTSMLRIVGFGIMPDGDSAFLATLVTMVPTNSTIPPTMSEAAQSGITRRKRLCCGDRHDDASGVGQHHRWYDSRCPLPRNCFQPLSAT